MTVARAAILPPARRRRVFAQRLVGRRRPGTPTTRNPLAANLNGAIDTALADRISGSIPLRASWCEVEPDVTSATGSLPVRAVIAAARCACVSDRDEARLRGGFTLPGALEGGVARESARGGVSHGDRALIMRLSPQPDRLRRSTSPSRALGR